MVKDSTQYLGSIGVAVDGVAVGAGVAHTDSELHVGYALRSVAPHMSYTPRLMQSAMPTPSNAEVQSVRRRTFHATMFALKADAELNACVYNKSTSIHLILAVQAEGLVIAGVLKIRPCTSCTHDYICIYG
jgi:hypothetical protein